MRLLYNAGIRVTGLLFKVAGVFNGKASQFVKGRKKLLPRIKSDLRNVREARIWMHCASLGEFEQGRPVMEALRKEFPDLKIVLTFFSPSGYELRKEYSGADYIYYLPWDTPRNATEFIQTVEPVLVIFVKYEFWFNYCRILFEKKIPVISISSIFRDDQLFFQSYGGFYRNILKYFSHFFVQNDNSVKLLRTLGIDAVSRAGDTRFDRVFQLVGQGQEIEVARQFKAGQKLMVAGSCWPEDFDVLVPFINEQKMKFIVAPHEISDSGIQEFEKSLQVKSIRYSKAAGVNLDDYSVLIIDNIGMLSKLYRYGEFAYVGGAFGKGLHNILEAACYGVPIVFGNRNYQKFQEAIDLINRGGAFEIVDYTDLKNKYEMLNVPENFQLACEVTRQYVMENLGATEKIMGYCRTILQGRGIQF
jgi:3-deoxy-D-manno-octulosonic-acid transferase